MYILKELWAKNFRSYKEFHLKDIPNFGLTLINGKNGAGKSSLRMVIEYLLTDAMSEAISTDEFTFNGMGDCELGCLIQDNEKEIKIIKYRDHKKHKNSTILEVSGDSESFTENDRRQTQKNIEKVLKITREQLNIASIFSQESLSFPKCTENDRKKILYDALDLNKYTEKHNKAKEKIKKVEKEINDLDLKKGYLEQNIEESKDKIKRLEEKSKEWERNRKEEIENYNLEIETIINKNLYNLDDLKKQKENINNRVKKYKNKIKEIEDSFTEINKEEREEVNQDYENLKKKKIQTEFQISTNKKELNKLGDGICPVLKETCNKLAEKEEEIKEASERQIDYLSSEHEKIIKSLEKLEKIIEAEKLIDSLNKEKEDEIISIERTLSIDKQALRHVEDSISKALSEEEEKKERIEKIKNLIEKKKSGSDPYIEMVVEEEEYIEDKKSDLEDTEDNLKQLYDDIKYWELLKVAYSKSGIPNMKIESALEAIELETNKVLGLISDKLYISIDSQSELKSGQVREKIDYQVHHPDKKIKNFWSYSGGQRQRINLASMFAFNELFGKFSFVVLDEVLELSLDGTGKEDIIKLLKGKVGDIGTILCISHDNSIKDSFNNVIDIKMRDEISYMEV